MTFPIKLASRLDPIKPSITLAVTAKAAKLKADGIDVVSFGAGEPDFDTPDHIKDAARAALDKGVGKYTEVGGILPLRKAIAAELSAVHNVKIEPDQVLVSTGAKHSLYNLFMALIDPGDEVLIPAPYWVSYPDMVMLAGGRPVILETKAEDDFAVTAEQVAAACSGRTRAIVLNNPSNPTGAVYTRAQIEALAKVVVAKDLLVISDDIYRQLVYPAARSESEPLHSGPGTPSESGSLHSGTDAEYVSIASINAEVAKRTVLVDGVSKTYAMTGWRIGYAAGPLPLIKAMSKIQGQSTSNPTHISQIAALAALTGPQDCVGTMRKAFDDRRKRMVELLRAIPGVNCREPKGAFYAFPDVSAHVGKKSPEGSILDDDVQLCDWLVEVGKVAVVPGSGFGAPGFVRLSYACSMKNIEDGVGRLAKALGSLK
jgi:aspartate aminotransferase